MPQRFRSNDHFTLGVELELQTVDRKTGALQPAIGEILKRVPDRWKDFFKPEFMQSYCEINTGVCRTVAEVERDLSEKLSWLYEQGDDMGLDFVWAGTHPFSRWEHQQITPGERYQWLQNVMQDIARRLLIFGLHVHVGVDSGDKAIHLCDRLLKHLPALLALSSNSPFFCGRDTGLASYRSKVIEALPTAGMPTPMRNWSEYVWLINHLIDTKFISSNREIWWDVRPHAGFGTVEMRIFDVPLNLRHTLGLVALTQCLIAGISEHIDQGAYQFDTHPMIAKQNKWHAARYGLDASFVDFDTMQAVPARTIIQRMVERCEPIAERLGCLTQLHFVHEIVEQGSGAQQQRTVYERSRNMQDVVRFLADQTALTGV